MAEFLRERGDVQYRPAGWLREDRWLIAGKTHRAHVRMRAWLAAARCGTMPHGLTVARQLGDYGRRN
jgi:hypothetical protein